MNVDILRKEVVEHRRFLHAHPEIGHQEFITQKYITDHLTSLGLDYQTYGTSTICDLIIDPNFELIATRADIDALALVEENEVSYKSKHEGMMHACGHDGHTAIQLAVISYLAQHREQLAVNVRFIFQCDEENNGGAEELCEQGYLDGVSAIYGLHLDNALQVGEVGYIYGQMNAGGNDFILEVIGQQAHGASPHLGVDSIVCSAAIINSAQQIVSRQVDPLDSTVVTIGTIEGAGTPNTICGKTVMTGTIRNLNPKTRKQTVEQFFKQAELIAEAYNCKLNATHIPVYPPLVNDDAHVDYVRANTESIGYRAVDIKVPALGLEDFAYYLEQVPGAFYNVGSCIKDDYRNFHCGTFDIDEEALVVGALVQIENCTQFGR